LRVDRNEPVCSWQRGEQLLRSLTTIPGCATPCDGCCRHLDIAPRPLHRAAEFLNAAPASKAACILVDIEIGDASGLELVRQLSVAGFRFPVIFMSGSDNEMFRRRAMDLGCEYLLKPFASDRLIEAIEKAIDSNRP
jgi:FixJ family two-component response regulator